jgi:hypothetical protein
VTQLVESPLDALDLVIGHSLDAPGTAISVEKSESINENTRLTVNVH